MVQTLQTTALELRVSEIQDPTHIQITPPNVPENLRPVADAMLCIAGELLPIQVRDNQRRSFVFYGLDGQPLIFSGYHTAQEHSPIVANLGLQLKDSLRSTGEFKATLGEGDEVSSAESRIRLIYYYALLLHDLFYTGTYTNEWNPDPVDLQLLKEAWNRSTPDGFFVKSSPSEGLGGAEKPYRQNSNGEGISPETMTVFAIANLMARNELLTWDDIFLVFKTIKATQVSRDHEILYSKTVERTLIDLESDSQNPLFINEFINAFAASYADMSSIILANIPEEFRKKIFNLAIRFCFEKMFTDPGELTQTFINNMSRRNPEASALYPLLSGMLVSAYLIPHIESQRAFLNGRIATLKRHAERIGKFAPGIAHFLLETFRDHISFPGYLEELDWSLDDFRKRGKIQGLVQHLLQKDIIIRQQSSPSST